jgi:hypothetical protein
VEYIGCWKDDGDRDLPTNIAGSHSPDECFEQARKMPKIKYVGLQNHGECWAGETYGKHGLVEDSECNAECTKDPTQKCGGPQRNSVYFLNDI